MDLVFISKCNLFSCYLKTEPHASRQLTRPCLGKPSFMLLIIRGRHLKRESILPNWALKVTKAGKQHEKNRAFCWVWVGSERTGEKDEQEGPGLGPILPQSHPRGLSKRVLVGRCQGKARPSHGPGDLTCWRPQVSGDTCTPALRVPTSAGPVWAWVLPGPWVFLWTSKPAGDSLGHTEHGEH